MDLSQLRYFEAVAKSGVISKAADELYVTQSSISKALTRLESELGAPLFIRRKGHIELNEYGSLFLSYVSRSLAELDNGISAVKNLKGGFTVFLSIASSTSLLTDALLRQFSDLYPDIRVSHHNYRRREMISCLLDGSLDYALFSQTVANANVTIEPIASYELIALVPEDHPLTQKAELHLSDLRRERFICDAKVLDEHLLADICKSYGFSPNIYYILNNISLVCDFIRERKGILVVPSYYFFSPLEAALRVGILPLRFVDPLPRAEVTLVYKKGRVPSAPGELFSNYIRSYFVRAQQSIQAALEEATANGK